MPNCRCAPPVEAVQRTVRKEGPNTGRIFYVCSKPQSDRTRCRFFEWGDAAQGNSGSANRAHGPVNRNHNQGPPPRHSFFAPRRKPGDTNANANQDQPASRVNGETGAQPSHPFFANTRRRDESGSGHQSSDAKRPCIRIGPVQNSRDAGDNGGKGSELTFALANTESVTRMMNPRWDKEILNSLRSVENVLVKNASTMGMLDVFIPLAKISEVEAMLRARHGKRIEFSFPRAIIDRLQSVRVENEAREAKGDVVSRPLNEILPSIVCDALMEFQWEGVNFALKHGGRCLIGDDMGLGKTLQAIAVARIYIEDWPLLIVCPSSLRLNWKEELLKWLGDDIDEEHIHVIMKGTDCTKSFRKVNIVSYDLIRKIREAALNKCKFIIADESHYLKNGSAKRSQAVTPIIMRAKRALLLSGTPALSRPVELFPQINSLVPTLFPNYKEFTERYCNAHMGRFGYDVSGSSNLTELHELLRGSVLIRRKKDDVLTQLPAKRRQVLWVATKPKPMRAVKAAFKELEQAQAAANRASDDDAEMYRNMVRTIQTKLYGLTATAKMDSILEFIKDTAETGCKFIVFAHHGETMEAIDEFLTKKLKLKFIRIDGKTPQAQRQSLCKSFQEDPRCKVSLLSITAAGVGLTLTAGTVVLFAELYWNPGSLLQAEDRAHRIGQRDCVLVKYLLAKGTLDESMWGTVRRKFKVIGKSLTGAAGVIEVNSQTQNEIEEKPPNVVSRFFSQQTNENSTQMPSQSESLLNTQLLTAPIDLTSDVIDVDATPVAKRAPPNEDEIFPESVQTVDLTSATNAEETFVDADTALAKKLRAHLDTVLD